MSWIWACFSICAKKTMLILKCLSDIVVLPDIWPAGMSTLLPSSIGTHAIQRSSDQDDCPIHCMAAIGSKPSFTYFAENWRYLLWIWKLILKLYMMSALGMNACKPMLLPMQMRRSTKYSYSDHEREGFVGLVNEVDTFGSRLTEERVAKEAIVTLERLSL